MATFKAQSKGTDERQSQYSMRVCVCMIHVDNVLLIIILYPFQWKNFRVSSSET